MARLIPVPGGEGPANEGERRVIARLLQELPEDYSLIPNVEIHDPGGQLLEFDIIVVAPHAVYVVETKDWRGEILADEREWLVNDLSRKSPLLTTERKAKVLKSRLANRMQALSNVRVEAVVCLAGDATFHAFSPAADRRTFPLERLAHFLIDPAGVNQRPGAISDLGGHVIQALTGQVRKRSGPRVFRDYEVVETLEQSEDEALYRARHLKIPGAPSVRLRVVSLSPYALTEEQRAARREALKREVAALLRMGSHANIVTARDYFEDDEGRVVLVLDDTEGRTLRQRLQAGTPLTVQERLAVLTDVCRALAHAHAHKVVHRLVEPESILLADDGMARLGRFSLAKLMEVGGQTVWGAATTSDADQRYLAPELERLELGDPGPPTDLYSLGCVAYELFGGAPPFAAPSQAFGPAPIPPVDAPQGLKELLPKLLAGSPSARAQDTRAVLAALESMRPEEGSRPPTGPKDRYSPGDLIDDKFEVRAELGHGGFSAVYRVYRALEDCEYAVKVFNVPAAYDKLKREIEILRRIQHPHVVRAVWADQTRAGQWYLVTEFVEGEPLTPYADGKKRLAPADAVCLACQLLAALEAIHPKTQRIAELRQKNDDGELTEAEFAEWQDLQAEGIVHRDIKPQNLMLTASGDVVLIDFNIASRAGERMVTLSGTPPYVPPDLVPGVDRWDVSPDLFATGVVLYELLCCEHPYPDALPLPNRLPRDPREFRPELSPALAEFLMKACQPYRQDRFLTAREMRTTLEAIDSLVVPVSSDGSGELPEPLRQLLASHPPNVNPLVREFLALSSQARRSNAATRGMDDLAAATYVETRLDADLCASVLAGRHRLVIVTGNAGDGKTAFIQQVEQAARRAGAAQMEQTSNGCRLRYAGREMRTLYDGSQDEGERTSDEVLREFFEPFMTGGAADGATRLAAINEGRLRDFLMTHRTRFSGLAEDVIATLDAPGRPLLGEDVVLVNLNLRSVTAREEDSIFSRQLQKIVGGPFWGPCESCDYRARCPLKHNVDTFRDSTSGPAATERLRALVDLVRLRRRRHLTMRDVRSLISHLLFRDRTCEEIPLLLESGDPFDILDVTYFQGPGGLGAPSGSALERGADLLAEIDVALVANPEDDRLIARSGGLRRMSFSDRTSDYPTELIRDVQRRAGVGYDSDAPLARRIHEAARRQAYFERADDDWRRMLPYERAVEFQAALDTRNADAREKLRRELTQAISLAEGVSDRDQASAALWLATSDDSALGYRCFRRFPLRDFELRVARVEAMYVEAEPDRLELLHCPSGAALELDIDLMEVLERLREGYASATGEGRGFLLNLTLFKNRLLALPSSELMLLAEERLLRIAKGGAGSVALTEESR